MHTSITPTVKVIVAVALAMNWVACGKVRAADEDPLPEGAVARLGTVSLQDVGPGVSVNALAFLPDGKTLAAGSTRLTLWNATGDKVIRYLDGDAAVGGLVASPDGKTLLAWMGSVRSFDAASGRELQRLKNEFTGDAFLAAALSPDGKMAATATLVNDAKEGKDPEMGMIRLWDTASGAKVGQLYTEIRASVLAFSPDGKTLAVALAEQPDKKSLELWDVAAGTMLRRLEGGDVIHQPQLRQLAFSLDSKVLAGPGPDNSVILWNAASGKEIRRLEGHTGRVGVVAYSPDGKVLASAGADRTVRLWDPETGKTLHTWQLSATALAFSPDGKLLAGGTTPSEERGARSVRVLDTATGKELESDVNHHAPLSSAEWTADGKLLVTAGKYDGVRVWEASTGKELYDLDILGVSWARFAGDGKHVTALGQDGAVRVWDYASGKELRKFNATLEEPMLPLGFCHDGKLALAAGAKGQVALWEVATGKLQRTLRVEQPQDQVVAAAVSQDGRWLATGGSNGLIRLWDLDTGKLRTWRKNRDAIAAEAPRSLVFVPPGDYLVASTAGGVAVFEIATGEIVDLFKIGEPDNPEVSLALAPNGRLLAVASAKTVRLVDLATGNELAVLSGHAARVNSLTFSADGKRLISVSADTTGLVWDVERWLPRHQRLELSRKEFIDLWDRLGDDDEATAYKAMWALADTSPASYALLRQWLRPVTPAPEGERIARLIAALDAEDVATRTKAYEELAELGGTAAATYRRALKAKPALEVRLQLEKLLARVDRMTPERLRQQRAVTALERSGTGEARQLLGSLAAGEEGAWLTEEAKHALERLDRKEP